MLMATAFVHPRWGQFGVRVEVSERSAPVGVNFDTGGEVIVFGC